MSVYTNLDAADIANFLKQYDQGELVDFRGIAAGIENTNYFVTTKLDQPDKPAQEFVLTLFETTPAGNLNGYFDLMANLAGHQLPTASALKTRSGSYLSEIKTKPAVLIERLAGESVSDPLELHCAQVGEFLARMHLISSDKVQKIENSRDAAWRESVIAKLALGLATEEITFLRSSHSRMCEFEQANLPKGNIHGDLFHDNALFVNDVLTGIIDFYYAHHQAYIYDLAVAVADWCFVQNRGQLHAKNAVSMASAYAAIRPLSSDEKALWPAAIELACLRFLLSRLHDKHFPRAGTLTQEKDPEVFRRLLLICQDDPDTLNALVSRHHRAPLT